MARFWLLTVLAVGASATKVTPLEKVIDLLTKLEARVTAEGEAEAKTYDDFACFCKEQLVQKTHNIKNLEKDLGLEQTHNATSDAEMDAQTTALDTANQNATDATNDINSLRETMTKNYNTAEGHITALKRGVSALKSAIEMVRGGRDSTEGQGSMKQNVFAQLPAIVLAQISEEDMKPKMRTSGTETGGVLELLRNLLNNFETQLRDEVADQRDARQDKLDNIAMREHDLNNANTDAENARNALAAATEENNKALSAIESLSQDKEAESNFLRDLTNKCQDKAQAFDQRTSTRKAELTALAGAINILKTRANPVASAAGGKFNLLAKSAKVSHHDAMIQDTDSEVDELVSLENFLQTSSHTKNTPVARALEFLRQQSEKFGSSKLSTLVLKAQADPFRAVKNMINKLITDLKQNLEDAQAKAKGCKADMKTTQTSIDEATAGVSTAASNKSDAEQRSADAEDNIKRLTSEIKENEDAKTETQNLSDKFQTQCRETVEEAKQGHEAVTDALKLLNDFYNPSFVQTEQRPRKNADADGNVVGDSTPDFKADYEGNQDAAGGIMDIMEVLQEDFKKTWDDTEADAKKDRDDTKAEVKRLNMLITKAKGDRTNAETDNATAKEDLADAAEMQKTQQDALDNAKKALAVLEEDCVKGESYEERQQKRENEIASLKEALEILDGADVDLKTKGQD